VIEIEYRVFSFYHSTYVGAVHSRLPPMASIKDQSNIKHLKKFLNVCGGQLMSMNFPPRNWERYYAYSSRVEGKLCLLIGVRTLSFICLVIYVGLVHDKFCLVLYDR
jgi:hypothetical protein